MPCWNLFPDDLDVHDFHALGQQLRTRNPTRGKIIPADGRGRLLTATSGQQAASLVMEGLVPLISILRAPKDAERAIRMAEVVASAICATISAIRNRESLPDASLSIGSAAAAAYISNRVSPSGHSAGAIIGGGITSFAVGGAVSSAKTAIHISINSSRNRGPARRVTV